MNPATVTTHGFGVTATELFASLVDPHIYPHWLIATKNIREVSLDWPSPGSYFKHTVGFGPIAIPDRTTLRDVEAPHRLTLFVRARPVVEAVVHFDVTSSGKTCMLRMTETPTGIYKLIAPLTRPLIRARNDQSMQRLAAFIKARHAPDKS